MCKFNSSSRFLLIGSYPFFSEVSVFSISKSAFLVDFAFFTFWLRFRFSYPVLNFFMFSLTMSRSVSLHWMYFPSTPRKQCRFFGVILSPICGACSFFLSVRNKICPEICFRRISFPFSMGYGVFVSAYCFFWSLRSKDFLMKFFSTNVKGYLPNFFLGCLSTAFSSARVFVNTR